MFVAEMNTLLPPSGRCTILTHRNLRKILSVETQGLCKVFDSTVVHVLLLQRSERAASLFLVSSSSSSC